MILGRKGVTELSDWLGIEGIWFGASSPLINERAPPHVAMLLSIPDGVPCMICSDTNAHLFTRSRALCAREPPSPPFSSIADVANSMPPAKLTA